MIEQVTEALVLTREDVGDYDSLLSLYTKDLGKVTARATSMRKITSKLNAHTLPGYLTTVRLAAKSATRFSRANFRLTDALRDGVAVTDVSVLGLIKKITVDFQCDDELWDIINDGATKEKLLMYAGFGSGSRCGLCTSGSAPFFYADDQLFLCAHCSAGIPKNLLISV